MTLVHGRVDQMPPGWLRVWLYGSSGSGKSLAAATFPKPHFLQPHNEDSVKSLRGLGAFTFTQLVPTGEVRSDLLGFADQLYTIAQREGVAVLHEKFGQTLVIEAYTHFNDLIVSELASAAMSNSGKDKGKMDEQKWGLLRAFILQLRDSLWRLPMHIVITSLARLTMTDRGTIVKGEPLGQGAGCELMASSCDAIGFCERDLQGRYVVDFGKLLYTTRTRFFQMPPGPYPNFSLWSAFAPYLGY